MNELASLNRSFKIKSRPSSSSSFMGLRLSLWQLLDLFGQEHQAASLEGQGAAEPYIHVSTHMRKMILFNSQSICI